MRGRRVKGMAVVIEVDEGQWEAAHWDVEAYRRDTRWFLDGVGEGMKT